MAEALRIIRGYNLWDKYVKNKYFHYSINIKNGQNEHLQYITKTVLTFYWHSNLSCLVIERNPTRFKRNP